MSYTMTVIVVNFLVPLTVMFYCYYHVAQSMRRYAARNCTAYLNRDWADQADVTKARSQSLPRNVVGSTALNIHRWKVPPPRPPPRAPFLSPYFHCPALSAGVCPHMVDYHAYLSLGCLCVLRPLDFLL